MLPFDFLHDFNVDGTLPFEAFGSQEFGYGLAIGGLLVEGMPGLRAPGPRESDHIGGLEKVGKVSSSRIPATPGFSPKKWFLFWGGARGASQQKDGQMMMSFAGSAAGKFALRPCRVLWYQHFLCSTKWLGSWQFLDWEAWFLTNLL